jgi:catechol 2,3-dioxygenase-like lactoylglutathione lyase family enzyme
MLDHVSLGVGDFAHARAFYDRVLAPLGARLVMLVAGAPGHEAAGYGLREQEPKFWIGAAKPVAPPPAGQHVAFAAPDRAAVDAFHREALLAGARDNGAPGLRPHYHANYYAAFVIDPDGHHLEAVCHRPA